MMNEEIRNMITRIKDITAASMMPMENANDPLSAIHSITIEALEVFDIFDKEVALEYEKRDMIEDIISHQ